MATVLVLGASGALVTATVENGTTTVTFTQASPSPSVSASPTTSPAGSTTTLISAATVAQQAGTVGTTPNPCSTEAHEINALVKDVNDTFHEDHQALEKMRKDARTDEARKLLNEADKELKAIRQAAVKALHESFSCAKGHDDEDEDQDEDEDNDDEDDDDATTTTQTSTTSATTATTNLTGPSVAFSGSDPKAIADLAIAAMDLQVEKAKEALAKLPSPTPRKTEKPSTDSERGSDKDRHDNNGKGGDKGHR